MPADRPSLVAAERQLTGKRVSRLRSEGRLPAVVYGHGIDSANISIDAHEFELLRRWTGANTLIDLDVDGAKSRPVLVHGVQVHPVTRRTLHVDFFLVRMSEEMTVDVPLVPVGEAPGAILHGGTLHLVTESVRVRALPDHLPQSIEFPVDSLVDFEATISVRDLQIPGDATLLTDADEVVAKVLPPRVVEEPQPAEEQAEAAIEAAGAGASEPEAAAGGGSGGETGTPAHGS